MKYSEIVNRVRERAELQDREAARHTTIATLSVLGERLAGEEPANLAAQLPEELRSLLIGRTGAPQKYDVDEFVRQVADREGGATSAEEASRHVRVVLSTIGQFVSEGEMKHLRKQLPSDYAPLFDGP